MEKESVDLEWEASQWRKNKKIQGYNFICWSEDCGYCDKPAFQLFPSNTCKLFLNTRFLLKSWLLYIFAKQFKKCKVKGSQTFTKQLQKTNQYKSTKKGLGVRSDDYCDTNNAEQTIVTILK